MFRKFLASAAVVAVAGSGAALLAAGTAQAATPAPIVTSITLNHGAHNDTVVVSGSNLTDPSTVTDKPTAIDFGPSNPASITSCAPAPAASCIVTVPSGTGTVSVSVTTVDGTSDASSEEPGDEFTYGTSVPLTLSVTNPGPQFATIGVPFSLQLSAQTDIGQPPAAFYGQTNIDNTGLNLSTSGLLSGTPVAPSGLFGIDVHAHDGSLYASAAFALVVRTVHVPVLDNVTPAYVCGHMAPRAQFRITATGTYNVSVRMTEVRRFTGLVVGDGTIIVHPGRTYYINANDSVALRLYYQANGTSGPVIFKFARVPSALANQRNC
jgi:hypothetical protein